MIAPSDLVYLQIAALRCAVVALIAEHPNKDRLRSAVDMQIGSFIADALVSGEATPEVTAALRKVVDGLFPHDSHD